jgi:transcriptional regulator with XRE-family HTH domain
MYSAGARSLALGEDDRGAALRAFLREHRARISPNDAGLPVRPGRRLRGLSAEDVAELIGVSTRWYLHFEAGNGDRRFSLQFLDRVAAVLQLDEEARITLYRLALHEVDAAAAYLERSVIDGAFRALSGIRRLSVRLFSAASFEEAVIPAIETVQNLVQPDCVTVANLICADGSPIPLAVGPRAAFVGPTLAASVVNMNKDVRSRSIVLCESAPEASSAVQRFDHPIQIQTSDGRKCAGLHEPEPDGYRTLHSVLGARSQIAAGLFERGVFRGNLAAFWCNPRQHKDSEVDIIATVSALLELARS